MPPHVFLFKEAVRSLHIEAEFICHKDDLPYLCWNQDMASSFLILCLAPKLSLHCFEVLGHGEKAVSAWWGYNRLHVRHQMTVYPTQDEFLSCRSTTGLLKRQISRQSFLCYTFFFVNIMIEYPVSIHIHINISCHIVPTVGFRKLRLFHLVAYL